MNDDLLNMQLEDMAEFESQLEIAWEVASVMGLPLPLQNRKIKYWGMPLEMVKELMPAPVFALHKQWLKHNKKNLKEWSDCVDYSFTYYDQTYFLVGVDPNNMGLAILESSNELKLIPLASYEFNPDLVDYNESSQVRYATALNLFAEINRALVASGSHTFYSVFDNDSYKDIYVRNVDRLKGNNFSDFKVLLS